jgi:hypothetical protein
MKYKLSDGEMRTQHCNRPVLGHASSAAIRVSQVVH